MNRPPALPFVLSSLPFVHPLVIPSAILAESFVRKARLPLTLPLINWSLVTSWVGLSRRSRLGSLVALVLAIALLISAALIGPASAQSPQSDDQAIFAGALKNSWQANSWATLDLTSTDQEHGGTPSISVIADPNTALYFRHDPFQAALFDKLTFWIYGTSAQPETLTVQAVLPDPSHPTAPPDQGQTGVPLTVQPGWQFVTLSMADLSVAARPNVLGFWIINSTSAQESFYVSSVTLTGSPVPASVHVAVDAAQTFRIADDRMFGLNTGAWDPHLDTDETRLYLGSDATDGLDLRALRFPGGSTADDYHWNASPLPTSFDQFAQVALRTNAQAMITVNYGSGTAQEAADWVNYANNVQGYGVKYWEIGNEVYGSWETDTHTTLPDVPHDPATYARYAADYMTRMRAADPRIKVGVVMESNTEAGGWNDTVLTALKAMFDQGTLAALPDFVVQHHYAQSPSSESDLNLLMGSGWNEAGRGMRAQLQADLGPAGSSVEMLLTEANSLNATAGKQTTSLTNGLYLADSLGQVLASPYNGFFWWDLRNAKDFSGNSDDGLYGWREYGDFGLLADEVFGPPTLYPTFYVTKLLRHLARGGDAVVSASADFPRLSAYSALREDGTLSVMVINKGQSSPIPADLEVSGYTPSASATVYSYGQPQDSALDPNSLLYGLVPPDAAQTTLSGSGSEFSYTFPAYSVTLFSLAPVVAPGTARVLWRHQGDGQVSFWNVDGVGDFTNENDGPYPGWTALAAACGTDGVPRVAWVSDEGALSLWGVDTAGNFTHPQYGPYAGWGVGGLAVGSDNLPRILWQGSNGAISLWSVDTSGTPTYDDYGPYPGWSAQRLAVGGDNRPRLAWIGDDGSLSLWTVAPDGSFTDRSYGPYAGWHVQGLAAGPDSKPRLLWQGDDGEASLWSVGMDGSFTYRNYGPYPGWTAQDLSVGSDNHARILWSGADGSLSLWSVDAAGNISHTEYGPYSNWFPTSLEAYP